MRTWRVAAVGLLGLGLAAAAPAIIAALRAGPPSLDVAFSTEVTDRSGRLLRAFTVEGGPLRLRTTMADVDGSFIRLLLAIEDHRFADHAGVDPYALLRALWQDLRHGRIVSGGSTLTMQTVTLLTHDRGMSLGRKLRQATFALMLEQRHNKTEILAAYLSLAPFGGNIEGIRAASLTYFHREPRQLDLAQSATLIALAQSPEKRRPDRHPLALRVARDRVIAQAYDSGLVSQADAEVARSEPVPARTPLPMLAAHVATRWHARQPTAGHIRLTLDADLQRRTETTIVERLRRNPLGVQAAAIVVDNATGELLASVGSVGFSSGNAGMLDHTRAVRSPGSTLKPFIYGLAFDAGLVNADTLIDDRRMRFGTWAPNNFDGHFAGTVSVREALQASLNLPAVDILNAVGTAHLRDRLRRVAIPLRLPRGAKPSLAIALGGAGIRLIDLVQGYAALARSGEAVRLVDAPTGRGSSALGTLLTPQSAYAIYDILREAPAPEARRHGAVAFKTGTSFGFRDAWAIGFDRIWTVGVWLGRPDGSPVPGLYGRHAAAPLLFDIFALRGDGRAPLVRPQQTAAERAASYFGSQILQRPADGSSPLRILFPADGAAIQADEQADIPLEVSGGIPPYRWLIDGRPALTSLYRRQAMWRPESLGFVRITVVDRTGAPDTVHIRLVAPGTERVLAQ
jgi:penicillin-binding protein 1C